jgi:hypothetical protein
LPRPLSCDACAAIVFGSKRVLALQCMFTSTMLAVSTPPLNRQVCLQVLFCAAFAMARFSKRWPELPGARHRARRAEYKITLYTGGPTHYDVISRRYPNWQRRQVCPYSCADPYTMRFLRNVILRQPCGNIMILHLVEVEN